MNIEYLLSRWSGFSFSPGHFFRVNDFFALKTLKQERTDLPPQGSYSSTVFAGFGVSSCKRTMWWCQPEVWPAGYIVLAFDQETMQSGSGAAGPQGSRGFVFVGLFFF